MSGRGEHGWPLRAERLLSLGAAVAYGVLGWSGAHALTSWLLAHHHEDVHGGAVRHVHDGYGAMMVLAACLGLAGVAAGSVAAMRHRESGRGLGSVAGTVRWASGCSIIAFILAEFVESAVMGTNDVPPPRMLLLGAAIQIAIGVATALLWRHGTDRLFDLAAYLESAPPATAAAKPTPVVAPYAASRRRWLIHQLAGRAPPTVTA